MDKQTKVGIGASALFTFFGIRIPLFGWWIGGAIMLVCAAVAAWGLAPLVVGQKSPFGRLSLREGAQIAYDTADGAGLAGIAFDASATPASKLQHMADMVAVQKMRFYARKLPSQRMQRVTISDALHPNAETNELTDVTGRNVLYTDVAVSRWDFWGYLRRLRREGRQAQSAR